MPQKDRTNILSTDGDDAITIWNGGDIKAYSDSGDTLTWSVDGATGAVTNPSTAATFNVGTFASAAVGGTVLSASRTKAVGFYADDGDAALTPSGAVPDIKTLVSRCLILADQNAVNIRAWGAFGQLKVADALINGEQVGGVNGRLEVTQSAGTTTLAGYGFSSGVCGIFATAGTVLVNTNHVVAGVSAIADIKGTVTQTGIVAGLYVGKYDTTNWSDATSRANWSYGLYIPADACNYAIQVGKSSSSAQTGQHLSNTYNRAVGIYTDDNNAALAGDVNAVVSRMAIFAAQNGGAGGNAIKGQLRIVAANILPSSSKAWSGVQGYAECSGTHTIGDGTNFTVVSGINATAECGTTTIAANGVIAGIHVCGRSLTASPTGESIGILFQAVVQGFEHTFGFSGVGTTDGNGLSTGSDSTNVSHKIAIWINGVGTRYIHVFTD